MAMEIRREGEENVQYGFYYKILNRLGIYNSGLTPTIIFGDKDMVSARRLLENSLNPGNTPYKLRAIQKRHRKKQVGELLSADTFEFTQYIPLRRETIPLLDVRFI